MDPGRDAPAPRHPGPAIHAGIGQAAAGPARGSLRRPDVRGTRAGGRAAAGDPAPAADGRVPALPGGVGRVIVDSHCHLDYPGLAEREGEVVARAREAGVGLMVTIATKRGTWADVAALAGRHPEVVCAL